ncbi:alanine racemase [Fuchsiella alkaliacetigena]|uniref:alanine racemase n=1 Tax=Fuchsiella alkaliacetigena TaxID=957042 RepID=UPI00200B0F19|nr:alanine racemase [Fuchsiella alkaliacetigena]MCK8824751.1 alanine racemase [Fuchsiella alkaliacetigena]
MIKQGQTLRPAWAEIDLAKIEHNILQFKKRLAADTLLMAVVKANAYGHGAVEVTKTALAAGVDKLAVAILDEALELKEAGFDEEAILILGWTPAEAAGELIKQGFAQTIYDYDNAQALSRQAVELDKELKVHVKVDTGMSRIGVQPAEAVDFIKAIHKLPKLVVEGVFTHFALADEKDKSFTYQQFNSFKNVLTELAAAGLEIPIKHCANSAACLDLPETQLDMVRLGISIYGLFPSAQVEQELDLKPALSLKAKIAQLKEVPAGTGISYGHTYTTSAPSKIATIPLGYDDGYSRLLSSNSEVLVNGQRAPVVGRVCMDQFMVDVSEVGEVQVAQEVVLIGKQGSERITVEEIAARIGTINYEVVCMLSSRVPRVYINL